MTPIKSVYFEVNRLSRDRDMHIPHKMPTDVFHCDTTGHCKHQQKKTTGSI